MIHTIGDVFILGDFLQTVCQKMGCSQHILHRKQQAYPTRRITPNQQNPMEKSLMIFHAKKKTRLPYTKPPRVIHGFVVSGSLGLQFLIFTSFWLRKNSLCFGANYKRKGGWLKKRAGWWVSGFFVSCYSSRDDGCSLLRKFEPESLSSNHCADKEGGS